MTTHRAEIKTLVPLNRTSLVGNELAYMQEATGGTLSGDGAFTKRIHRLLEEELGVDKVLLTTNCTHALEMAALLLDFQPGDEVILPSFTFVSTANAFVLHGARPIFVDIRRDTLNLDETQLEQAVTARTKAIVVVHYAGIGCEMDRVLDIGRRHGIAVVEDNAHGLFGRYKGAYLGTLGCLATLSFHETKNFTCGEGGALLINDPRFSDRAEIIREKGTNRSRFFRGQVDKYTWVDVGSSYLPADLLAAYLYAQLEVRESIQASRRRAWEFYDENLSGWAAQNDVRLPFVPAHCEQPYHIFYMLLPSLNHRQAMIAHLKAHGIQSAFHYVPLHLSDMGMKYGAQAGQCPVTEEMSDRLLRLPLFYSLTEQEQDMVVGAIRDFDGW